MAQIVGTISNIFRCNLLAIQSGGSQANTILAADEVWLIDSTNSLTDSLSGNCDAYIVGDGTTAASALQMRKIVSSVDSVAAGSRDLITSGGVYNALSISTGESILYPNYSVSESDYKVSGTLNKWIGFGKNDGISEAGILKNIHIGFSVSRAFSSIPCRISKVVRSGGTITGLSTLYEFSIDVPVGDGVVNVYDKGLYFSTDSILEINFAAFGRINTAELNIGLKAAASGSGYIRFDNQALASGSIFNINVEVSPSITIIEKINEIEDELEETEVKVQHLNNVVGSYISPNYKEGTTQVQGTFNAWYGFASVLDLPSDGYITELIIGSGNVKVTNTSLSLRISQKVRANDGTITGLNTIEEFTATIDAGSYRAKFSPKRFLADYVIEFNAADLGAINVNNNFNIKYTSNAADNLRYVRFNNQTPTAGSMWDVNAVISLDVPVTRRRLKMLVIGNSFSEDAFSYVPYLIRQDVELTIGILYYGGATLANHNTFLTNGDEVYTYEKCVDAGVWQSTANKSMQFGLKDEQWDVIVLQQASTAITSAAIQPALNTLINNLYSHLSNTVKLAWHFTLARETDYATSVAHYNEMVDIINDTVVDASPIGWVIPTGTAMQNARTSSLQSLGAGGNLMNTDLHAQEGIPCYVLACCAAESIYKEMGIQDSIFADNTQPTQLWVNAMNIPHPNGNSVGVNAENMRLAQYAALQAVKKPFEITTIS